MGKFILVLFALLPVSVFAADVEIVNGVYAWKTAGISMPLDEGWYIGKPSKSGYPSLIFRISEDQVLNLMFANDDEKMPILAFTKAYLADLQTSAGYKLLQPIVPVQLKQSLDAYYLAKPTGSGR